MPQNFTTYHNETPDEVNYFFEMVGNITSYNYSGLWDKYKGAINASDKFIISLFET